MTIYFRPILVCNAVAAALFSFLLLMGVAAAAFCFYRVFCFESRVLSDEQKNKRKFNFYEILNLYYNIMMNEFALKAKLLLFCKKTFAANLKTDMFFGVLKMGVSFIFFIAVFLPIDLSSQEIIEKDFEYYSKSIEKGSVKEKLEAINFISLSSQAVSSDILARQYRKEKDNYLKIAIIEALSVKNSTTSIEIFTEALNDNNPEIKKAVWLNMPEGFLKQSEIKTKMIETIKSEKNRSVKLSAINSAVLNSSSQTLKAVSDLILDDKEDKQIRLRALECLGAMDSADAKKEIDRFSKSKDKDIADAAKKKKGEKKAKR